MRCAWLALLVAAVALVLGLATFNVGWVSLSFVADMAALFLSLRRR